MILIDTGPLVALFDRKDPLHSVCVKRLEKIKEPMITSMAVLAEAFHILTPESQGANGLCEFIEKGGLQIDFMDLNLLFISFELMQTYRDQSMDLADATLIALAQNHRTFKIFTLDENDFSTYRIKKGHRYYLVEII